MITQRGVLYYSDFDLDGKRIRRSLKTGDKVEAMKRAVALYEELSGSKAQKAAAGQNDMTLKDAIDQTYRELWVDGPKKAGLCSVVKSRIGDTRTLRTVDKDALKELAAKLLASGIKGSTVNRNIRVITAVVNHARREWTKEGYGNLPPLVYKPQPEPQTRLRYLSEEEVAALLAAEDDRRWRVYWMSQLESGVRMSDGLAIEWRYFDWRLGTYFNPNTKNNNPQALPLSVALMDEFQWLKDQKLPKPFDFPPFTVRTRFMRLKKRAGINDKSVTVHTLRHTCATRLLAAGADIREVQIWLGHKNITTTERYAKVIPGRLMKLRDRIHGVNEGR